MAAIACAMRSQAARRAAFDLGFGGVHPLAKAVGLGARERRLVRGGRDHALAGRGMPEVKSSSNRNLTGALI